MPHKFTTRSSTAKAISAGPIFARPITTGYVQALSAKWISPCWSWDVPSGPKTSQAFPCLQSRFQAGKSTQNLRETCCLLPWSEPLHKNHQLVIWFIFHLFRYLLGIPWLTHLNHRSIKFHLVRFIMNPSIFIFLHILIFKPLWPLITLRLRFKRLHIAGSFVGPLGINGVYCAEYLGSPKKHVGMPGGKTHSCVCICLCSNWDTSIIDAFFKFEWISKEGFAGFGSWKGLVFPGILNSGSKETQRRSFGTIPFEIHLKQLHHNLYKYSNSYGIVLPCIALH